MDGLQPQAVLRPGSAAEITDILRFAAAEQLAVIPMGGRTKLGIGMPPKLRSCSRSVAHESRAGLRSPRPYVWRGSGRAFRRPRYACWQPSASFCRWRRRSLRAQHWAASSRRAGIRRCGTAYGSASDFLLGVEFITGDAVSSKSGGRVVKNVTGYDLHKLLIGSLGTLAVITRLNFRTFPLPSQQATFVATFASADAALAWCAALAKSPLEPKIVEMLGPGTARLFGPARDTSTAGRLVGCSYRGRASSVVDRHARDCRIWPARNTPRNSCAE